MEGYKRVTTIAVYQIEQTYNVNGYNIKRDLYLDVHTILYRI